MEIPVCCEGRVVGSAALTREGLYLRLQMRCEDPGPGVRRLYGCLGTRSVCLGVPQPEDGGLRLERRLSGSLLPGMPEVCVLGRPEAGFLPWRGTIAGEAVPEGWIRADGTAAAVPFDPEGTAPLTAWAAQMRSLTLGGRLCLCLPLEDGAPAGT